MQRVRLDGLGLRTVLYTAYGRIIYGTNTVTGTRKP